MTAYSNLDDPLFRDKHPPSLLLQQHIIAGFWGIRPSTQIKNFEIYFKFYHTVCSSQVATENAVKTHKHLIDLVSFLKQARSMTKSQIRLILAGAPYQSLNFQLISDAALVNRSLDLAIRLWLMVSVGSGSFVPGQTVISWADDQTYDDLLRSQDVFPKVLGPHIGKTHLSPSLTAYNVVRYGGVSIKWTYNLVDHLILNQHGQLLIYHHVAVLTALEGSNYLPDGLVDETIRTIAVLFPNAKQHVDDWLRKIIKKAADRNEHVDPAIRDVKAASLEIEKFEFWRHRLLVLEKAYNKSEPRTLWQWWIDRRKRREWATFWVAILVLVLTILFGLIQSVTGIAQVVFAIRSFNVQNAPPNSTQA
jgi:hypothetical protein